MIIRRRKKTQTETKLPKKIHEVDGFKYNTKILKDYHIFLADLKAKKIIKSFSLPQVGETKSSKYKAYKVEINNIEFDSLNESRYYLRLLAAKKDKKIKDFEIQKPFEIVPAHKNKRGKAVRKMEYYADFVIINNDNTKTVVDVKGIETDVFKLKKKLVEYLYPEIEIICVKYFTKTDEWLTTEQIKAQKKKK